MKALLISGILVLFGAVGAGSVYTGVVRTPVLDVKYSAFEGYVSKNDLLFEPEAALSFENKLMPARGASLAGSRLVEERTFTQEEINSFVNLKILPNFSLKGLVKNMPGSLRNMLNPVLNITGFNVNDINFVIKEDELIVSGHLSEEGRAPFYIRSDVVRISEKEIKVDITQASLGLIDIKGSNLEVLNKMVNDNIQNASQHFPDYRIDDIQLREGEVYFKGFLFAEP
jgi:hypothetical protein